MVLNQSRSNRKPSGARYKYQKVRRQHESGRPASLTKVDVVRTKSVRTLGGNEKKKLLSTNEAYVLDSSSNKSQKVGILSVSQNPANRHFVRRNIMTKGAVIETDLGFARITNRPGQEGVVHAVLIKA